MNDENSPCLHWQELDNEINMIVQWCKLYQKNCYCNAEKSECFKTDYEKTKI